MPNFITRAWSSMRAALGPKDPLYAPQSMGGWGSPLVDSRRGLNPRLSDHDKLSFNFGLVRAAVMRVGEDVAALKLSVSDTRDKPLPEHPLAALLEQPNPWLDGHDFMLLTVAHLKIHGRAAWLVIESATGEPVELHVLYPDRLDARTHPTEFVSGYRYRAFSGQQLDYPVWDARRPSPGGRGVLEIKIPNPSNPYAGDSDIQAASADVGLMGEVRAYLRWYFANSAVPGSVLETLEPYPGPDAARARVAEWREQFQGAINAGKHGVVFGGAKINTLAPQVSSLQYPELSKASREEVLAIMGVPPSVLGLTMSGTLAGNAANQERENYERSTLDPMRRRLQRVVKKLAGKYRDKPQAGIESPVTTDEDADRQHWNDMLDRGVVGVHEYRAHFNLPDDGRVIYLDPSRKPLPDAKPTDAQAKARAAQYREMFANERKIVDARGWTPDVETALHGVWERIAPDMAEDALRMRRYALERADTVTAFELLKSEGAKILARGDA